MTQTTGALLIDPGRTPALVREEKAGSAYMVHAVASPAGAASLIVRGPAEKDRFVVINRDTGKAWWQYAQIAEKPEDQAKRRLGAERVGEIR